MLKSYNELSRWYSALEPQTQPDDPARGDTTDPVAGDEQPDDAAEPFSLTLDFQPDAVEHPESKAKTELFQPDAVGNLEHESKAKIEPFQHVAEFDDTTSQSVDIDALDYDKQPIPVEPAQQAEPEPLPAPPAQLADRRSDYTGGWSDWVADPAPATDDDYDANLVQFPWPDAADEYDDARVLEPSGALRANRKRHRAWVVLAISVLVLVVAATGVAFLLFGRGGTTTARHADSPLHFTAGNLTADPAGQCPTERTDTVVRSAEAGGTDSGPDAVLAFQHAYYVTRSGAQARAVVTPDADVSPAAVIQRGIDTIPVGTTHCVRITTVAADRFTVEVTEFRPAGAPATYTKQSVRTAQVGDRTLITGIAAG
ncbi:hypothetical protein [Nocardia sp. NPDC058666]|uniref:hypothetical protein n=1 Tax=Nocardia sp. NPDC058666 TaxID=3346587 RepID=UPI00366A14A0